MTSQVEQTEREMAALLAKTPYDCCSQSLASTWSPQANWQERQALFCLCYFDLEWGRNLK